MKKNGLDIDVVEKKETASFYIFRSRNKVVCEPTELCLLLYNLIQNSSNINLVKLNFRIENLNIHSAYDIAVVIKDCKLKKIEFVGFTEYLSLSHMLAICNCDYRISPPLTGGLSFTLNFKHFFLNEHSKYFDIVKIGSKKLSLIDFNSNSIDASALKEEIRLGDEIIRKCVNIILNAVPQKSNLKSYYATAVELTDSNLLTHACYEEYLLQNIASLKETNWKYRKVKTLDSNRYLSRITHLRKKSHYILEISSNYWDELNSLNELRQQLKFLSIYSGASGILLIVNYKGGSYESADRIWCLISSLKMRIPVNVYIKVAASSGYCIASAGEKIFINPCGYLGNVGTILFSTNYDRILRLLGVDVVNNVASPLKNEDNDPNDLNILNRKAEIAFTLFLNRIAECRKLSVEFVKEIMDGSNFTSEQSIQNNFADSEDSFSSVLDKIRLSNNKNIHFAFIKRSQSLSEKILSQLSLFSILKFFLKRQ